MTDVNSQRKLGIILIIGAWGIFLGLLTYLFHNWYSFHVNPNQDVHGVVLEDGSREVRLTANYQSHYFATGTINSTKVTFFIDTGASHVVIPLKIAKKLKLDLGASTLAQTAGGVVRVYLTKIDELQLGNIYLRNVSANVNPEFDTEYILLGMSALKRLELQHKGNELILRLPNTP